MSEEAPTGKAPAKRGTRRRPEATFITKTEIGAALGVGDLSTLDSWIAAGSFPPPHSRPGERFAVWLRKHWQAYVDGGEWPREAWGKGPR